MSNQQQTPVTAYPVDQSNLAAPPPPVGYPTKDDDSAQQTLPVKTTTRGDGFWKGWKGCSSIEPSLCRGDGVFLVFERLQAGGVGYMSDTNLFHYGVHGLVIACGVVRDWESHDVGVPMMMIMARRSIWWSSGLDGLHSELVLGYSSWCMNNRHVCLLPELMLDHSLGCISANLFSDLPNSLVGSSS
ncbi:hypothetical protein V8G54_025892 [Vigna mungo]|uniref:Uncharacterized protein n=1 Tax=Vigna mungo TaxID=3915 RepID=A0AAQ3RNY5_VIGMU